MKYLLFFTIPLLLLAGSCSKEKSKDIYSTTLEGEWELYQSYSGMMPLTTYNSPNGNRLHFTTTTYKFFADDNVVQEGAYSLAIEAATDLNSCDPLPLPELPNTIIFNGPVLKKYFELKNGKLKVWSGCFPLDGGYCIYKKIKEYNTEAP
jgi:hypothetical protein